MKRDCRWYTVIFHAEGRWQAYNSYNRKVDAEKKAEILRRNGYTTGVATGK